MNTRPSLFSLLDKKPIYHMGINSEGKMALITKLHATDLSLPQMENIVHIYSDVDVMDQENTADIKMYDLASLTLPFDNIFLEYNASGKLLTELRGGILYTKTDNPTERVIQLFIENRLHDTVCMRAYIQLNRLSKLYCNCPSLDVCPYKNVVARHLNSNMSTSCCMTRISSIYNSEQGSAGICNVAVSLHRALQYFIFVIRLMNSKPSIIKNYTSKIHTPGDASNTDNCIYIRAPKTIYKKKPEELQGSHRSPIEHERRKHERHYNSGKVAIVEKMVINKGHTNPYSNKIKKEYVVTTRGV